MQQMNSAFTLCVTAVFKHVDDMTFINSSGNDTHFRQRRNAVLNPSALWPRGNIPYIISTRFNGMVAMLLCS